MATRPPPDRVMATRPRRTIGHTERPDTQTFDGGGMPEVDARGQSGLFGQCQVLCGRLRLNYGGGLAA